MGAPTQEEKERAFKALSGWPFGGTFSALYDIICQLLADSREVDKARIAQLEEDLRDNARDAATIAARAFHAIRR